MKKYNLNYKLVCEKFSLYAHSYEFNTVRSWEMDLLIDIF